jgi:hypothetical protein
MRNYKTDRTHPCRVFFSFGVVCDEADAVDGLVKLGAEVPVGRRPQQRLLRGRGAVRLEGRVRRRAVDSAQRLHLRRRAGQVPKKGPRDNAGVLASQRTKRETDRCTTHRFYFNSAHHIQHTTPKPELQPEGKPARSENSIQALSLQQLDKFDFIINSVF